MGDTFGDRLESCRKRLKERLGDKVKVTDDACFTGLDAYKNVLACDVDMVILTTTPHWRPMQLKAAIEADTALASHAA